MAEVAVAGNINGSANEAGAWEKGQKFLLGLFDNGLKIYDTVQARTDAQKKVNAQAAIIEKGVTAPNTNILGIPQNYLLIGAAVLTGLLILKIGTRK